MPLPVQELSFSPKTPVKTEYFLPVEACLNPTIVFLKHADKSEFDGFLDAIKKFVPCAMEHI